ncbi:MAG: hypothetical protein IKK21_07330, partial [Clostridia bacterium]|nr:hypothetical protein [Clostridia bacterium]
MQGKSKTYHLDQQQPGQHRTSKGKILRNWLILIALIAIALGALRLLTSVGKTTEIAANRLTCFASQDVTPFGDSVLYYDGASIHCLSDSGAIRWSFPVG